MSVDFLLCSECEVEIKRYSNGVRYCPCCETVEGPVKEVSEDDVENIE